MELWCAGSQATTKSKVTKKQTKPQKKLLGEKECKQQSRQA